MLIVIFATSGALEDAATKRTEDSGQGLLDLAPDRATRIDAEGVEQPVKPQDLRVGELVIANLAIAAIFITGLVAWDLFGQLPLPLGVAGHEGSTIIVALNGLRLLNSRSWQSIPPTSP